MSLFPLVKKVHTVKDVIIALNSLDNRLIADEFEEGKANDMTRIFLGCREDVVDKTECIFNFTKRFVQFLSKRHSFWSMPTEEVLSVSIIWWGSKKEPPVLEFTFPFEYTNDVYKVITDAGI